MEYECVLCEGLIERNGFNMPLYETENFVVLADRLPVSDYHLIIVSKKHLINMFDVIKNGYCDELQSVIEYIDQRLRCENQIPLYMFEHGQKDKESKTGGKSVEHFHLHIISKNSDILKDVLKENPNYKKYKSILELKKITNIEFDYLLIRDMDKEEIYIITMPQGIPSQYLRKVFYNTMNEDVKNRLNITGEKGFDWKKTDIVITKEMINCYYKLLNQI